MIEVPEFPLRVTLELTNLCNYHCAMCPSRHQPDSVKGFMEPALFHRLVDEIAEHLPVTLVPFFRGETLLHPKAVELIAHAKSRGLGPVQLATNGSCAGRGQSPGAFGLRPGFHLLQPGFDRSG